MSGLLVTFQPGMEPLVEREVHAADSRAVLHRSLEAGLWQVLPARDDPQAERLLAALAGKPPISLRHLHPVQLDAAITEPTRAGLGRLVEAVVPLAARIGDGRTWSVQTRFIGPAWAGMKAYDINDAVVAAVENGLTQRSASHDRKAPQQVISVSLTQSNVFAGTSETRANLSSWPGGMARYSGGDDPLSRAKKKLMEAVDVFGLDLADGAGRFAIDLGAAPGGWTQFLLEKGFSVVAVDPADLDARLVSDRLMHFRGTAERFFGRSGEAADLLTSDMRMDARDAARMLVSAAGMLKPGGCIITTLKLPERGLVPVLDAALEILSQRYVVRARHLFHNRSEVTAHLVPRR
jgi:23S rRNA (cytidine2498-2'-O)-methyltransferase